MSFIGLDIGTTGCKAIVFDERWKILAKASREYPILTPRPGWAEQDPELVWKLAVESLAQATAESKSKPMAMTLSVQGEAVMPVDRDGNPLRHAILGMDTRTTAENDWLAAKFGAEDLYRRTGMPIHTMNTLNKLLWLRKNEPDIWRSAHQFLLYEDFFIRRLTGNASISHCLASRTQMYDLHAKTWASDILDKCEIDGSRLAALAPEQGGVVGTVGKPLADRLGLEAGLLIASGGHDQACAALGSGVRQSGLAMVSTGTAEVVEVAMASPVLSESLRRANISIYRHVVPELYLAMTLNHSGGLLLRWFRDTLCRDRCAAAESGKDAYDLILADAPRGPTNLMVLPHFAGSGTPLLDTTSRGAILGLSFASTRAEIAKAILEGLTFELRLNLELLKQSGIDVAGLHAVGGGAKSDLWLQLKADVCRTGLRIPRVTEAACLGAAMVASVAAGANRDVQAAAARHRRVRFDRIVTPDDEMATKYDSRFELYRQLYPQLIHLLRQC
jgi:xylulokinase